jgi:hypothetical protein
VILAARGGTAHASATETQTATGVGNWAIEADGNSGADGIHVSNGGGTCIDAVNSSGAGIVVIAHGTAISATSTTLTAIQAQGGSGADSVISQATGGGYGVNASSDSSAGVYGSSSTGTGVFGSTTASTSGYGVVGINMSGAAGSAGVYGESQSAAGGQSAGIGVKGFSGVGDGVVGSSYSGYGVVASSGSGTGLSASSSSGSAIVAASSGVGYGLYLTALSGWAMGCNGRIRVLGNSVGTATLLGGSTTLSVPSSACSGSSLVMLTPSSDPLVRIWATVAPGVFTIHASSAPASNVTFTYFLIN